MRDREFIPALLTEERVRRGLTLTELANLAGLNRKVPGMLERGEHVPIDLTVGKLAAALGCHAGDLSRPRTEPAERRRSPPRAA